MTEYSQTGGWTPHPGVREAAGPAQGATMSQQTFYPRPLAQAPQPQPAAPPQQQAFQPQPAAPPQQQAFQPQPVHAAQAAYGNDGGAPYGFATTGGARLGMELYPSRTHVPPATLAYVPPRKRTGRRIVLGLALVGSLLAGAWFYRVPIAAATGLDIINIHYLGNAVEQGEAAPDGFTSWVDANHTVAFDVPAAWADLSTNDALSPVLASGSIAGVPVEWSMWGSPGEGQDLGGGFTVVGSMEARVVLPIELQAMHDDAVSDFISQLGADPAVTVGGAYNETITTTQGLRARHSAMQMSTQGAVFQLDVYSMARGDHVVVVCAVAPPGGDAHEEYIVDSLRIDS